jgi:hypothetical protein
MLCTAVRGLPLVYNILFYLNIYFVVSLLSDQIECKQRQIHHIQYLGLVVADIGFGEEIATRLVIYFICTILFIQSYLLCLCRRIDTFQQAKQYQLIFRFQPWGFRFHPNEV